MKFKYSAIGDNTQENREYLDKIGYTMSMATMDKALYIKTQTNNKYYETNKEDWCDAIINCIGNPQLFRAVTALRDDSDYMQVFYIDVLCGIGGQMVGSEPKKRFWSICKDEKQKNPNKIKATLSELTEYYKKTED